MNELTPPPDRKVTYKALNSEAVAAARAAAGAAGLTTEDWLSRVILENARANGMIGDAPADDIETTGGAADEVVPFRSDGAAVTERSVPYPENQDRRTSSAEERDGLQENGQGPDSLSIIEEDRTPSHRAPTTDRPAASQSPDAAGLAGHIHQAKQAADQAGLPVELWLNRAILDSARAQTSPADDDEVIGGEPDATAMMQSAPAHRFGRHPAAQETAGNAGDVTAQSAHPADGTQQHATAAGPAPTHHEPGHDDPASNRDLPDRTSHRVDTSDDQIAASDYPDIRRGPEGAASGSAQAVPQGVPQRPAADPVAAQLSDPLQERLARIVAARREEQARFDHPDDPPMILASRPGEAGRRRTVARSLADFDEVDRRSHSGNLSWFWMTMMIILTGLAGIIWALPFIGGANPDATRASAGSAKIAAVTVVQIPPQKKPQVAQKTTAPDSRGRTLPIPAHQHVEVWRKAAEAGNHTAQIGLARLLIAGRKVARDPAAAVKLLRDAADRGNRPEAQFLLAYLLERGLGVKEKSFVDATLYYQKAAAQGYMPAVTEVGIAFLHGIGVKRDFQKAFRYLERAAEAGQAKAQFRLGHAYEKGIGVTRNKVLALKWYILAAERQHAAATARIEDMSHKTKKPERDKATELAREFNQRYRDAGRIGTPN